MIFDLQLGAANDDGGRDGLTLLLFQTAGPLITDAPNRVHARALPENPEELVRVSLTTSEAVGRVCFAGILRDMTDKVSNGSDENLCQRHGAPIFPGLRAVAGRRAARPAGAVVHAGAAGGDRPGAATWNVKCAALVSSSWPRWPVGKSGRRYPPRRPNAWPRSVPRPPRIRRGRPARTWARCASAGAPPTARRASFEERRPTRQPDRRWAGVAGARGRNAPASIAAPAPAFECEGVGRRRASPVGALAGGLGGGGGGPPSPPNERCIQRPSAYARRRRVGLRRQRRHDGLSGRRARGGCGCGARRSRLVLRPAARVASRRGFPCVRRPGARFSRRGHERMALPDDPRRAHPARVRPRSSSTHAGQGVRRTAPLRRRSAVCVGPLHSRTAFARLLAGRRLPRATLPVRKLRRGAAMKLRTGRSRATDRKRPSCWSARRSGAGRSRRRPPRACKSTARPRRSGSTRRFRSRHAGAVARSPAPRSPGVRSTAPRCAR